MAGSMTLRRRIRSGAATALALAAAVGAAWPHATRAETLADRARVVLEAHCTDCRVGQEEGTALDLETLAGDPRLVVPQRPDASRIYQRLLRTPDDGKAAPTPAEIETVRDWIESLPARDAACRDRAIVTSGEVDALIDLWSQRLDVTQATDTRFLSLVHLWNACATAEQLKEARDATAILLAALARSRDPLEIETLGEQNAVFAVRLSELALLPAEWARLIVSAPTTASVQALPADWLAARILAHPKDAAGNVDPAFDVAFDAAGQRAVEKLARAWDRDVDLVRAAAERGVTPRALSQMLAGVGGEFLLPARRLMHGALSRAAWDRLSLALDGAAKPGSVVSGAPASDSEIDVLLWTDQPFYRPRDLVTVNVTVSKACHLTLIDLDRDGKAIVLFPNELEQDNLVAPSVTFQVPGRDAEYQFRFDRSGEEEIVAICQRKSRRPDGIAYDYEKQRFAILGDWRTFLRTVTEREKQIRDREGAEAARRKRRGRSPTSNGPPAVDLDGPAIEGRAAITVTIDEAGR